MAGAVQQRSRARPALALLLAGSLLLQTGCASLAEIRDFAAMAKQASESFPPMMEDMKDSFIRTRQMDNLSRGLPLEEATKKAAAKEAKFAPTRLSGEPVMVNGVLVFNFVAQ